MRRLAIVVTAALLIIEWHSPATAAASVAPEPSPPEPDVEVYTPPPLERQVYAPPVASPPPQPQVALAPPQAPAPPQPTTQPRRQRPPHRRVPLPPKQEPMPPRLVVPPQDPAEAAPAPPLSSSPPLPPPPRMIRYPAGASTTLLVFGDSSVDPGNNNQLRTVIKANFLPYGINFYGSKPTGRFSNGRLATDILAQKLGIARSIPGFHDPKLKLRQLSKGVSFASAGSGYDDSTAKRANALSFSKQIDDLWQYKLKLRRLVGRRKAELIVNTATFILSAGTDDLFFHYLVSNQSGVFALPQYESYLITQVANCTQVMRSFGGRRFVFVGVPPIGCLPIARTLMGTGADRCDENLNMLATSFNSKLVELMPLLKKLPGTKATYADIYTIITEATKDPKKFGLSEVSRGCCGTGVIEVGQTCKGRKTCLNPCKYMYWDAIHPTERMHEIITDGVIMSSIRDL